MVCVYPFSYQYNLMPCTSTISFPSVHIFPYYSFYFLFYLLLQYLHFFYCLVLMNIIKNNYTFIYISFSSIDYGFFLIFAHFLKHLPLSWTLPSIHWCFMISSNLSFLCFLLTCLVDLVSTESRAMYHFNSNHHFILTVQCSFFLGSSCTLLRFILMPIFCFLCLSFS